VDRQIIQKKKKEKKKKKKDDVLELTMNICTKGQKNVGKCHTIRVTICTLHSLPKY
jgi:hypothetical protein